MDALFARHRARCALGVIAGLLLSIGAATPAGAARGAESPRIAAEPVEESAVVDAALPGVAIAETLATTTGIAITPLLGVSAVGAWQYYRADPAQRAALPWFASRWFWIPGMALALLLVFKDPILGLVPGAKKPLDAVDVVENKLSAVLATPAVIALAAAAFATARPLVGREQEVATAGVGVVGGAFETVLQAIGLSFGAAVFLVAFVLVWVSFHAINVLILLSPFGPLDLLLRSIKLAVLAVLGASTLIHPYLGLLVALLIVAASIPLAGWAFRFMVFGWVMAADLIFRRHRSERLGPGGVAVFSAGRLGRARVRTYGRLLAADGTVRFLYRPWLVFPRREIRLPAGEYRVGRGLICPCLCRVEEDGASEAVLRLAPRYRSHEAAVAVALGLTEIEEMPLRRGLGAAMAWVREMAGRGGAAATRLADGARGLAGTPLE